MGTATIAAQRSGNFERRLSAAHRVLHHIIAATDDQVGNLNHFLEAFLRLLQAEYRL